MTDSELQAAVRAAIEKHGGPKVARALGLSVEAACRVAGGIRTHAGTRLLARQNVELLAQLDAPQATEARR